MASVALHSDYTAETTCVSNIFIDEYMPEANGEFVKVYLYLLRCIQNHISECSVSAIADVLDHTEKDVVRALKYWDRMGVLRLEYGSDKKLSGVCLCQIRSSKDSETVSMVTDPEETSAPASPAEKKRAARQSGSTASPQSEAHASSTVSDTPKVSVPARKEYSADETRALSADPDVTELLFIIETYLKKPLTQTDIATVLFWYDQLHFASELIVYLVEYCISKNHSSLRYMDKVAQSWFTAGITSVEDAKAEASTHSKAYYGVMKALGITGRNLVDSEIAFIDRWTKEYGYDMTLIQEACNRTISAIHQPSFEYTDSIIANWHKNKVLTKEDIAKLDAARPKTRRAQAPSPQTAGSAPASARRTGFTNFNQRNINYDELEAVLLTTRANQ